MQRFFMNTFVGQGTSIEAVRKLRMVPYYTGPNVCHSMIQWVQAKPSMTIMDASVSSSLDSDSVAISLHQNLSAWVELNPAFDRVLITLHSGGFCIGHHHPVEPIVELARNLRCNMLSVYYRKCPEHSVWDSLEDAFDAYQYLLHERGVPANKIVLCGQSAGGGLAALLLMHIRDKLGQSLLPCVAFLSSPFVDVNCSHDSYCRNANSDVLLRPHIMNVIRTNIALKHPHEIDRHKLSALHKSKHGLPPLFISASPDELLIDECLRFTEECRQSGVLVELDADKPMTVHATELSACFVPEARETLQNAQRFIEQHLSSAYTFPAARVK